MVVLGVLLADTVSDALSSVFIEVGVGVGLVAILVALERHLVREVGERVASATTEAVEQATAEIRDRITRLEDLDEAQAEERSRRRQHGDQLIERVRSGEVTADGVGELLAEGFAAKLFDVQHFRVRTSSEQASHVLRMLPDRRPHGLVVALDFKAFGFIAQGSNPRSLTLAVDGWSGPPPVASRTAIIWTGAADAAEIAGRLETQLEQRNVPRQDFQFSYALHQLVRSVEVMRRARAAERDSPYRLRGTLWLLINDGWAITSHGLEAVDQRVAFAVRLVTIDRRGVHGPKLFAQGWESQQRPELWDEALRWVTDRENWSVVPPKDNG